MQTTITGTPGFLRLLEDAEGRVKAPTDIASKLDPNGIHVCHLHAPLDEGVVRAQWLIATESETVAIPVWMDNGVEAWAAYTVQHVPGGVADA